MTTSTDTAITLPIDATHVRALRNADSIVFRLHNGQATIEANKDARSSADGFDHQTVIYAGGQNVTDYARDGMAAAQRYSAFEMAHSGVKYDPLLATLVGRLGKGDTVALLWRRGNDNESTRNAGIVTDDLSVRITKPSGRKEIYLVAYQSGEDNSARMVRRSH